MSQQPYGVKTTSAPTTGASCSVGPARSRVTAFGHTMANSVSDLLSDPQLSRVCGIVLGVWFPFGRGGVGVQVEACAECRPACPVRAPGGFRAGRAHALVP